MRVWGLSGRSTPSRREALAQLMPSSGGIHRISSLQCVRGFPSTLGDGGQGPTLQAAADFLSDAAICVRAIQGAKADYAGVHRWSGPSRPECEGRDETIST